MSITVKIDSRRDYELRVKQEVAHLSVSNKVKAVMRKTIMKAFDEGRELQRDGHLIVETNE